MTKHLVTCIAVAVALLAPRPAAPASSDGELRLSLGYDGRLLLKVLDIEVRIQADRSGFTADSELTSSGILALVKHVHQVASTQGRIEGGEARPGTFETQNLGGKTHRKVRAAWSGGQVAMTAQPPFDNLGDPPASAQQKLVAADPLTQLIRLTLDGSRARSCGRSYLFFDGKQLYALDFGPAANAPALDARQQRLGLAAPFQCPVRYREVAGFRKKPPPKRNQGLNHPILLEFARLGADGPLLIVNLRADTPLGHADIELARVESHGHDAGAG